MASPIWVWQTPRWPNFTFDTARLIKPANQARDAAGELRGKAAAIGAEDLKLLQAEVWSQSAVATAAIEGETLDMAAVRSSVAARMGILGGPEVSVPRHIEGLLQVMNEAATEWQQDLTEARLIEWHTLLFPDGRSGWHTVETGTYRTQGDPMQVISGSVGREVVHYSAPPAAAVRAEMRTFLDWFNRTRATREIDGILRAGIAHFWFESIHPFSDGNGRLGRAIIDRAISQETRAVSRLQGTSMGLHREQKAYYEALNAAQRGTGDITDWLVWFADAFAHACRASIVLIEEALARARFWHEHSQLDLNVRQRKALNRMLTAGPGRFEGGMTTRKYAALNKVTFITSNRDLVDLVEKCLLVREGGGRSTYYNLTIPGWDWHPAQN
jgi:Fic family protein